MIKKIATGAAAIVTAVAISIITAVLVSKAKDHAYKKIIEKHDKETAERLSKSFNEKAEQIEKASIKGFKRGINDLCQEMQIEPAF